MSWKDKIAELWAYRELVRTLVARDLKVRYKNSVLGIAWSLLNPLLMMLVFTVVFKYLVGESDLPAYPAFILCGVLSWNFFSQSAAGATTSIVTNAHLINKVYFPREILPISTVLSGMVNYLLALPVYFVLAVLLGINFSRWVLLLPVVILIQLFFTIGISLILATVNVFYRDTQIMLGVVLQAWFFLTPIFYPITRVPETRLILGVSVPLRVWFRRLNPMASIVATYRDVIYWGARPGTDFFLRTTVTALVFLVLGYVIFKHYSPVFGEEI